MGDPLRVLLVDDEEEFTAAMAQALDRRGVDVRCASAGEEALEMALQAPVDVAVLDVRLPGMDGYELFARLRSLVPRTAIVFLTGHGNVQQAFASMRQGAFDYLSKPCTVEQLLEVLQRAAGLRHASDEEQGDERIRVLLLDAEQELLDALSGALQQRGFEPRTARTQQQALQHVADGAIDVALVDIAAPGVDGVALLHALREQLPDAEVLVLTGHPAVGRAYAAVRAGAYDFLLKPQGVEVLAGKLRRAYRRVQSRRERRLA